MRLLSIAIVQHDLSFLSMQVPGSLCAEHNCYRSLRGSRERALVACGFMVKAGGWDAQDSARPAYSAVLVLRGGGWYGDAAGRRWPLAPGTLFQRFTGIPHSVRIDVDPPWAECWIHLDAAAEAMLAEMRVIDRERPVLQPGIDLPLLRELWREVDALEAAPDRDLPRHQVRLLGMLLGMLGGGGPEVAGFDADRACRLLADDPRIDLRLVARELGLPYGRFRKAFRAAVGIGPGEYRLRRRLDRARAALLGGSKGVAEIAAELGYASPFTFTALFRKHVGMSPSAWRRGAGRRPSPR
jgi:AraC-like DNA-binding protein